MWRAGGGGVTWYELIILALSEAADIINYGRVEEVEEVEANSKGPQKQHHPSEIFCNSLDVFITLYYYL